MLAEDYLEKETCLLFFSGICHYVHNQSNGGKQWRFPKRGYLHPVSPRRVERKGGHMGSIKEVMARHLDSSAYIYR